MSDDTLLREIRDTVVRTETILSEHIKRDEDTERRMSNHIETLYRRTDQAAAFESRVKGVLKGVGIPGTVFILMLAMWDKLKSLV